MSPIFCLGWFFGDIMDDTKKYDFFPFIDYKQYIRWYFNYTYYHLENILDKIVILWLIMRLNNKKITMVARLLLIFAILRLVEYWTFRGHISMMGISFSLMMSSFMLSWQWLRK